MRKYLLALALAGTAIGGAAVAGQAGTGRADMNKDGSISRAEFLARGNERFAKLDANGDGVIAGDELPGRSRLVASTDTNKDGKITKAEYAAQMAARFTKLDTNGDGQISRDEMRAGFRGMRGAGGSLGGPAQHMGMPSGPEGAMGHGHGRGGMMARADADHDGRISRAEALARAEARFARLDANHDGFIDKAEMDAAHARMKERMGGMRGHGRHHRGGPGMAPAGAAVSTPDAGQ